MLCITATEAWEREIFLFCFSCFFRLILIKVMSYIVNRLSGRKPSLHVDFSTGNQQKLKV